MNQNWIILKFGGSSVGEIRHWRTITEQVQHQQTQGYRPLLVLSALKNVSNLLEALLHQSLAGVHTNAIFQLKELHTGFASQLGLNGEQLLANYFENLAAFCDAIYQQQSITPEDHAKVLAIGELLSSTIGAAYLSQQDIDCDFVDVRSILKADTLDEQDAWHHFTSNRCGFDRDIDIENDLASKKSVIVTQGFIASDEKQRTVLLGREGSDTSASYLASILGARELQIWTDVPGVFSYNPRMIADARQIKQLSYAQAERLTRCGAKVLHPRTIQPVKASGISVTVKSTLLPKHKGTVIGVEKACSADIIAMASHSNVVQIMVDKKYHNFIRQQLLPIGFDRVNLELSSVKHSSKSPLLFTYSNTEQQQPSAEQLRHILMSFKQLNVLDSNSLIIDDKCSAISLIGAEQKSDWKHNLTQISQQQRSQLDEYLSLLESTGVLIFIVRQDKESQWVAALHKQIFETDLQSQASVFGERWQEIMALQ
jgi:diaminopimelate decarboxylase/aspartate kinase